MIVYPIFHEIFCPVPSRRNFHRFKISLTNKVPLSHGVPPPPPPFTVSPADKASPSTPRLHTFACSFKKGQPYFPRRAEPTEKRP